MSYFGNRRYNIIFWCYLYSLSRVDGEGTRVIDKVLINCVKMAKIFCSTRQTITRWVDAFAANGMLIDNVDRWIVKEDKDDKMIAFFEAKIKYIIGVLDDKAVSLYFYILNKFFENEKKDFELKNEDLKFFSYEDTEELLSRRLLVLRKLGLLNFKKKDDGGYIIRV